MNSIGLLIRIIGRAGTIGECAHFYLMEEKNRAKFIEGCFKRLTDDNIRTALGEHLIHDIEKYMYITHAQLTRQ